VPSPEGAGLHVQAAAVRDGFALEAAFSVRPGETLALVGPSGAGKTTCLSLVAGLHPLREGHVVCDGETWSDAGRGVHRAPDERRVGLVFQDGALFPHLSVRDNVLFGARARHGGREGRRRADQWLARLALDVMAGRPVTRLSGGERQRVALARALASGPSVLLLDEPFAALDVQARRAVRGELRAFLQEVGLPTVVVAHDPLDALVFGDRIVVLEGGRVTQSGPRGELLARPRTPFVAELAGLNVHRADVAPGTGLKEARSGDVVFHVLADGLSGSAYLAFAPSEVILSTEPRAGSVQNAFAGEIREIAPLPDRLRVTVAAGVTLIAEATREAAQALALAPGRRVWALVKATAIRVYP
jgi:molybdate transport system ATP-binding protein